MKETKIFKIIVFLMTRAEKFTQKLKIESDIGGLMIIVPFLLNLFAIFNFFDNDSTLVRNVFLFGFIPLAIIIGGLTIIFGIFLTNKDRYIMYKKKFSNDIYFKHLDKKKNLIDIVLMINGVLWFLLLIISNTLI